MVFRYQVWVPRAEIGEGRLSSSLRVEAAGAEPSYLQFLQFPHTQGNRNRYGHQMIQIALYPDAETEPQWLLNDPDFHLAATQEGHVFLRVVAADLTRKSSAATLQSRPWTFFLRRPDYLAGKSCSFIVAGAEAEDVVVWIASEEEDPMHMKMSQVKEWKEPAFSMQKNRHGHCLECVIYGQQ
ncbi:hypothetical protein TREES_T100000300 [Tupaia chinensis]|uniref:Uncharacterized protein n=1 Tax=Tupaia chinensis TaxID=246437 RepID=L9L8M2_TUPCH|nr:hypothetical protein TREES_T100000300 [Tupaia chinensis]